MNVEKRENGQENNSPFKVEKVEMVKRPLVEINKDNKLVIDGLPLDNYDRVHTLKHKNDPDLVSFHISSKKVLSDIQHIIDIKNPKKEFLTIERHNEDISVNGHDWDSLCGRINNLVNVGIELDSEGKNVIFKLKVPNYRSTGKEKHFVVVNNKEWKTEIGEFYGIASNGDVAYAFGGGRESSKLVINDKEWVFNRQKNKKNGEFIDIDNVKISKGGIVVVAVTDFSFRDENRRNRIIVGDKVGEKYDWKNTLLWEGCQRLNLISIDDKSGNIAVFGKFEENGNTGLIINDIPYEISGNPENLEYMDFQDGSLVIQYETVLGEKVAEKISLQENSKAIQEQKEKREAEKKGFEELRRLLVEENIPASEIITRLKSADDLSTETEKTKILSQKVEDLINEKMKTDQKEEDYENEVRGLTVGNANKEKALQQLKDILEGAGKVTLSSNFKLSPENMKLALDAIQEALKK